MAVNADKPLQWKSDIVRSVDQYNLWFMQFAPQTFRETRIRTTQDVESALTWTRNMRDITPSLLRQYPGILPMLRMTTAPPLARDRLIGLADVSSNLVKNMELKKRLPPKMPNAEIDAELARIGDIILHLADRDIFAWLDQAGTEPGQNEMSRAATIVADRLCGAAADPIIRNAQEQQQLAIISGWLQSRGYSFIAPGAGTTPLTLSPGTFAQRLNAPGELPDGRLVNIPIDTVIMPKASKPGDLPLFVEAKSAGDYTNPNKRRKEEKSKLDGLRRKYGLDVRFILFLCGYFDSGYLGYEAAEGMDWVWEHRVDDLAEFGI